MIRQMILIIGFSLTVWNAGLAQNYLKLGNDCFDKGDYVCAKRNYNNQKIFSSATGMETKIEQCNTCIEIVLVADFWFSDKDYDRAKVKYEALLAQNAKDPYAKKQIDSCNVYINASSASKTLQGVKLLLIKGGTFDMGSPESEPDRDSDETLHRVTLSDFYLSEKAITNEQFCRFLNAKGISSNGQIDESPKLIEAHEWGVQYTINEWLPAPGKANFPVVNVSWFGANAYCEWAGGRLPTEAEWEYACRAGTNTPFYTGNNLPTSKANYDGNSPYNNNEKGTYLERTQPVGSYDPNELGLYDMHGNVWEWCSDWKGEYGTKDVTNPQGLSSGSYRALRGGSWINDARNCRSASRNGSIPDRFFNHFSFRLAASP